MLPIPGEIFLRVINDMICANRAHHVQVPRAAYAGDFGSECFGELHRKRTHATRGAVNQNLLPGVDVPRIAQALQSGDGRHRNGGGLLERTIGRFNATLFSGTVAYSAKLPVHAPKTSSPS